MVDINLVGSRVLVESDGDVFGAVTGSVVDIQLHIFCALASERAMVTVGAVGVEIHVGVSAVPGQGKPCFNRWGAACNMDGFLLIFGGLV